MFARLLNKSDNSKKSSLIEIVYDTINSNIKFREGC